MSTNKQLVFELQNVISQLKRTVRLKHKHSKLKGAEKHILFLIHELNSQPVSISCIAKKMGVTLAAITHQITTLEKQGLIKRLFGKDDKRVVIVQLTTKGMAQVTKLKQEFAEKTKVLAKFLGEDDTKHLIRLVKKMSEFKGAIK